MPCEDVGGVSCVDGEVKSVVTAGDVSVDGVCVVGVEVENDDGETEGVAVDSVDVGIEVDWDNELDKVDADVEAVVTVDVEVIVFEEDVEEGLVIVDLELGVVEAVDVGIAVVGDADVDMLVEVDVVVGLVVVDVDDDDGELVVEECVEFDDVMETVADVGVV